MSGPFFVGGTGRCGTSQLTRVMGEHPQVHALGWESRFLRAAVGRLWDKLAWYEFEEAVPPLGYRSGLQHARGGARVNRRVVARYFPGRSELIVILREFTQDLFGGAAEAAGKRTWCEKTPFNLLSVRFLLELFPEATVVVIMRHPVEVAASHLDQPWAPSTLDGVLGWLEPVYQRWLAQRPALLRDRRYVEVKAGNLAARWPTCRRELFSRLGLPDADTASTFAPTRLVSRRAQLSDNQQAEVVSRLGWAAGELGYPARL